MLSIVRWMWKRISDWYTALDIFEAFGWKVNGGAVLVGVIASTFTQLSDAPVYDVFLAFLAGFLIVIGLANLWSNVRPQPKTPIGLIEFKPSEHSSYFHEWGAPSDEDEMLYGYDGSPIIYATVARVRLRVYGGGDTIEDVKVALTNVKDCEKLNGILPLNLRFKDIASSPHKTSIDLHSEDDQFVDVVSWKWDSNSPPVLVFHTTSRGDQEVPLKPYEITLRLTGKGIRSDVKRFWVGIGEEENPGIGLRKGLLSMRLLDG